MFKIGDFSKLTQISVRMLRYYESKEILMPIKIDDISKYRWYSVSQIKQVNKIKVLRDIGFQVDEIKQLLHLDDASFVKMVHHQKRCILQDIERKKQAIEMLNVLENAVYDTDIKELEYEVQIKEVPQKQIVSYRQIIDSYYDEGKLWMQLDSFINTYKIPISEPYGIAIFHDGDDIDVEVSYVVSALLSDKEPFQFRTLPKEDKVASILVYGSFDNIGPTYQMLAHWMDRHHYKMTGNVREIPINGPWNRDCEKEYLTEIQIPIKYNNSY